MYLVRPPKVKGRADIFPIIYGAHAHIHARTHYGAEAPLRAKMAELYLLVVVSEHYSWLGSDLTTLSSGKGTMNRPPDNKNFSCFFMMESVKFHARIRR
mmetsp:Transcript_35164/g.87948  ORF Transcript_35164/g.87948 Transcript_35164/m.87948 type:complete len:99 (+) Transcript_35164:175-471(+)